MTLLTQNSKVIPYFIIERNEDAATINAQLVFENPKEITKG